MNSLETKQKKVKVRGTGTYDPETNEFGFTPFNEGASSQTDVRSCLGGGKCWTTTGKDPSRMLSLKCKASSPDQYSDLLTQFNQLTRDLRPKEPKQLPKKQRVVCESGLECWLDEKNGVMTFTGVVDLEKNSRNWQAETLRLVQLVVRRLPASERFNKIINNLKNNKKQ